MIFLSELQKEMLIKSSWLEFLGVQEITRFSSSERNGKAHLKLQENLYILDPPGGHPLIDGF